MQAVSRCLSNVDMWQSTSLFNGQCPIETSGTNIAGFYKIGDQICELNYRWIKCEIGAKVEDKNAILPLTKYLLLETLPRADMTIGMEKLRVNILQNAYYVQQWTLFCKKKRTN